MKNRIGSLFNRYLIMTMMLTAFICFRAFGADVVETPVSLDDFFKSLVSFITNVKGAAPLVIAVGVTQLVLLLARTTLTDKLGKWKIVLVSGLTMVVTFLGFMAEGQKWYAALFSGAVVSAIQVFIHQMIKQITEKKTTPVA